MIFHFLCFSEMFLIYLPYGKDIYFSPLTVQSVHFAAILCVCIFLSAKIVFCIPKYLPYVLLQHCLWNFFIESFVFFLCWMITVNIFDILFPLFLFWSLIFYFPWLFMWSFHFLVLYLWRVKIFKLFRFIK